MQLIIQSFLDKKCSSDSFEQSAMLLARKGADFMAKSGAFFTLDKTLLHVLACNNEGGKNNNNIAELININPNCVKIKDHYEQTALQLIIEAFLDKKCSSDSFEQSAMLLARKGADFMAKPGAFFTLDKTLLHVLACNNEGGINNNNIAELININPDCVKIQDRYKRTALQLIIEAFLDEKCSSDSFEQSAMILVRAGADFMAKPGAFFTLDKTLLHLLACNNECGINNNNIAELIEINPDCVKIQDRYKRTALQLIIEAFIDKKCSFDSFKQSAMLLARRGADITVRGGGRFIECTLLHILARENKEGVNNAEIFELVAKNPQILNIKNFENEIPLELMADLTIKDSQGATLIHYAVLSGDIPLIKWLINTKKINLDEKDSLGETALHRACKKNNLGMISCLGYNRTDHTIENNDGYTASEIARNHGYPLLICICTPKDRLFDKIKSMEDYGVALLKETPKGQVAIDLASELRVMAKQFFATKPEQCDFSKFEQSFTALLHSKDPEMSEYRFSWKTVAANVAIALTGIGLIPIAGKVVYSLATQGRPLFFFQQDKTTREQKIAKIQQAFKQLA